MLECWTCFPPGLLIFELFIYRTVYIEGSKSDESLVIFLDAIYISISLVCIERPASDWSSSLLILFSSLFIMSTLIRSSKVLEWIMLAFLIFSASTYCYFILSTAAWMIFLYLFLFSLSWASSNYFLSFFWSIFVRIARRLHIRSMLGKYDVLSSAFWLGGISWEGWTSSEMKGMNIHIWSMSMNSLSKVMFNMVYKFLLTSNTSFLCYTTRNVTFNSSSWSFGSPSLFFTKWNLLCNSVNRSICSRYASFYIRLLSVHGCSSLMNFWAMLLIIDNANI